MDTAFSDHTAQTRRLIPIRPIVDRVVRVVPLPRDRIQIRTPADRLTIGKHAALAVDLLTLCNGRNGTEEIIETLVRQGYSTDDIESLLSLLSRKQVLASRAPTTSPDSLVDQISFSSRRLLGGAAPKVLVEAMRSIPVYGTGHLAAATRVEIARLGGDADSDDVDEECARPPLMVIVSDYENNTSFMAANQAALEQDGSVLFACIADTSIRLGPLVVPGETACFACFHHRLRANLSFREEFDAFLTQNEALDASGIDSNARIHARIGASLIVAQVLNFLHGATHQCVLNRTVEINPASLEVSCHAILRLPRCEVCGTTPDSSPPKAVRDWGCA